MNTENGAKVSGTYVGHHFTGTIESSRYVTTCKDGTKEYTVILDEPFELFNRTKTCVLIFAYSDGTPSPYSNIAEFDNKFSEIV